MDNLRLSAVADRVVAWHNRHPLARRISAAQVHAIGYVALPFAAEAPAPTPPVAPGASEAPSAPEAPSPAQLAAQAIAAAAAMPLPVLTDVALADAAVSADTADTANPANPANPENLENPANPATPAEGSRLRERALARAREQAADPHGVHGAQAADTAAALQATLAPATLKRDFSEHFIDTLTPRQVARFALKQGRVLARAPLDGPVREVRADSAHRGCVPAQVYLLTAVIETDTRKSRVLLGNGPQVLGRRIHSGPRIAALAAIGACVVGTPLWLLQPPASMPTLKSAPESMTAPGTDARLAMEGAAAAAAAAASTAAASATLPAVVASASAAASSSTLMAQGPAPVIPMIEPAPSAPVEPEATTRRRVVAIVPLLSDEQKALAREQRQALMAAAAVAAAVAPAAPAVPVPMPDLPSRPAAQSPAASPAPSLAPSPAPSPTPALAVLATAPTVPVFAISTRSLRTRSEADQVQLAMQSLLLTLGQEQVQVDVLPQGDDWRVVALPFPRRADAEKGRALLASRGMRVVVVDF